MKKNITTSLFFLLLISLNLYSQNELWEKSTPTQYFNLSEENNIESYNLDNDYLLKIINSGKEFNIPFPNQNGNYTTFHVIRTNTLSEELQKKFASVYTFKGVSTDGSNQEIRFSFSAEYGIIGNLFKEDQIINSITPVNSSMHEFDYNKNQEADDFICSSKQEQSLINSFGYDIENSTAFYESDGYLRRYKIIVSTTAEYSNFILDGTETSDTEKTIKVLTVVAGTIESINAIFEIELGITFQLSENTEEVFFFDELTDPYSNESTDPSDPSSSNLLAEVQGVLNTSIPSNNYDIGHLFHYDNGISYGAAALTSICNDERKSRAYTTFRSPNSNEIGLLAHEIGHQLGANHTQSVSDCNPVRLTAVEPGSGTTIMSYGGNRCHPNVGDAELYFNYTSIRDITNNIQNISCGQLVSTANSAPIIEDIANFSIPISTPFVLEAFASDINSEDILTYCWEQADAEINTLAGYPQPTQTGGPVFRSFTPTTSNKRYFPNLKDVVKGNLTPTWEVLPSVARDLNFSLVVRDNNLDVGKTTNTIVNVNVQDTTEPFLVTSPNTEETIWKTGDQVTVSWNVASTNKAPINTSFVDIYLSTDGGLTFNTKIITNTNNDGEATFNLPLVTPTQEARIMVKAVDNIFYSLNPVNFTIESSDYALTVFENEIDLCNSDIISFDLNYQTIIDFDETISLSLENLPETLSHELSQSVFIDNHKNGIDFTLNITGSESLEVGEYSFLVKGISNIDNTEKSIELNFEIKNDNLGVSKVTYLYPENNTISIPLNQSFEWENIKDATNYYFELSEYEDFNKLVYSENTSINSLLGVNVLEYGTNYYWRVTASNICTSLTEKNIYSFTTICAPPTSFYNNTTTKNSVSLRWNGPSDNYWEVEYGFEGFEPGDGTIITNIDYTFHVVNDLIPVSTYDFYLKTICSAGGYSEPLKLESITTEPDYCGEHFYDTGGEFGNYSTSEDYTITIHPDAIDERITVTFDYIDLVEGLDYLYVYNYNGISQDASNLIGEYSGNYEKIELTSTHYTGALTFSFKSSSEGSSGWDAEVLCEKIICTPPSDINASLITMDLVSLNWQTFYEGVDSIIEYGTEGFELGTGTEINIFDNYDNSYTISGLIPDTNYDVYIKSECLTPETYSDNQIFKFSTKSTYCDGERFYDTGGELGNHYSGYFGGYYKTTISPDSNESSIKAIFNYIELDESSGLTIYNGTTSGGSDNLLGYYTGNHENIEIISTHETGALTFVFFSSSNENLNYRGWDAEIICEELPNCLAPSNITVTDFSTNSAEISWDSSEVNNGYIIEYGFEGFTIGNGTSLIHELNSYSLTELSNGSSYDFYIKTNCASGGFSETIGPINFRTICVEDEIFENEYIIDGSFECSNTNMWWQGLDNEEEVTFGICEDIDFVALENSEKLCLSYFELDKSFYPSDGNYAAYISMYNNQGAYYISQTLKLPNGIENANLSFDIKALYYYNESSDNIDNFTTELIFNDGNKIEISKINITSDNIILYETIEFNYTFNENITNYLKSYEGSDIEIRFNLNKTEFSNIATDLMLDNVSLIIEEPTLSNINNEYLNTNITLYPNPNNGTFNIENNLTNKIDNVSVYDISGKLIQTNYYDYKLTEEQYTIKDAAVGIYFIEIGTNKGAIVKKIIVE